MLRAYNMITVFFSVFKLLFLLLVWIFERDRRQRVSLTTIFVNQIIQWDYGFLSVFELLFLLPAWIFLCFEQYNWLLLTPSRRSSSKRQTNSKKENSKTEKDTVILLDALSNTIDYYWPHFEDLFQKDWREAKREERKVSQKREVKQFV